MGGIPTIFNAGRCVEAALRRTGNFRAEIGGVCCAVGVAVVLAACAPTVDKRGHLPDKDLLAEIHPGQTTKAQVVKILGTPSSTSIFDDKDWYYISRKTEQVAFFDKDVLDQQVFVVRFDNKGVVRTVDHKDLKDARLVEPAPGATPAPGRELTFLEQILGNVGRFNRPSSSSSSSSGGGTQGGPNPRSDR